MLAELAVTDLGVIDHSRLVLGPGLTALTGETGAGKTMVVEAIELLLGGRADPGLVRPGASEAVVEGRFVVDGEEVVLTRVVPRDGRSRAYVDGRMATAAALAERGEVLVELRRPARPPDPARTRLAAGRARPSRVGSTSPRSSRLARRAAGDRRPARRARRRCRRPGAGGRPPPATRAARSRPPALTAPTRTSPSRREEDLLADATAHREAAASALGALAADGGGRDLLADGLAALADRPPFQAAAQRLAGLLAEVDDLVTDLRDASDAVVDDPERLAEVRARRQLLVDLVRKYGTAGDGDRGSGDLAEVLAYGAEVDERLATLEAHDETAAALEADRRDAEADERRGRRRRRGGPSGRCAGPGRGGAGPPGRAGHAPGPGRGGGRRGRPG